MSRDHTDTTPGTQPFDAPSSLVGRTLDGRFRLEETMAVGGMGILFEAIQFPAERSVVVKLLKPSLAEDVEAIRRFEREVEVLSRLSHPHVVSFIDSGRDAGGLRYLVMEYVEGTPFHRVLKESPPSLLDLAEIFIDAASALAEAHAREVVHRDLWFDNIVLAAQADGRYRVTVLDFGIAKPLDARQRWDVTRSGDIPGTPEIIAPELLEGDAPSPASDLYGLGVLFYTTLAGEQPFEGENEFELMRAHKESDVPPLQPRVPAYVPEAWIELTETLLAKDPDQRPSDASEVRNRLESIKHRLTSSAEASTTYVPIQEGDSFDEASSSHRSSTVVHAREEEQGPIQWIIRRLFGEEPVRAPMSVVIYLSLILLIQIIVIIYLIVP